MTAIRNGDGWSYTLTPTDKLWAGRMAQYEGGEAADVLWTMTQAYAKDAIHNAYPTFTRFIQAYSQPINPIWRRDGSKCRPGGAYHDRDECSAVRLERRDRAATIPWAELDANIREITDRWYAGTLPNPVPRAVEFAAPYVSEGFLARNPGSEVVRRLDNWYIATASSLRWPANWVTMDGSVAGIALVGGLVYVGYRYWRGRRYAPKRRR